MSRAAAMGLAHFMVTAAGGTPMEGLADDRCALDGSPCVHAGRIVSGRYREQNWPGAERCCRARKRTRGAGTIEADRRRLVARLEKPAPLKLRHRIIIWIHELRTP